MAGFFNRFGKLWALSGTLNEPTDTAAAEGFANIGQATPTVEQFNALFRYVDGKDNWLFAQIANAIAIGGETASEGDTGALAALFGARGFGQVIYATPGSGTFTVPRLVTRLKVQLWGAGGSAGSTTGNPSSASSAGGAGGYLTKLLTVTPGQVIAWTVGAGGAAPNPGAVAGNAGGNTVFGSDLTAFGGGGGAAGDGAVQSANSSGGAATGGDLNVSGLGGGLAYAIPGGFRLAAGGATFSTPASYEITSGTTSNGAPGNFPGGGGGGALLGGSGGPGSRGLIRVEW